MFTQPLYHGSTNWHSFPCMSSSSNDAASLIVILGEHEYIVLCTNEGWTWNYMKMKLHENEITWKWNDMKMKWHENALHEN